MITRSKTIIRNDKGEPIVLSAAELHSCNWIQKQAKERWANALGFQVDITTLTAVSKRISEQTFFEVAPADYIPVRVGEGAWASDIVTFRSFSISDQFETGIIDLGANNTRLATADAGVDSIRIAIKNWAKAIGYSIPELEQAARNNNYDVVAAKEKARKIDWDLGIQRTAFLGVNGLNAPGGSVLGLLNQGGITNNTAIITKPLSSMTPAELKVFQSKIIEAYRKNTNRTAWPDRFVIPESDYNGLASQASPDFPIKSTLELLEEAFKLITRNPGFRILPLAYADMEYSGLAYQVYALYKYDEDSIRMDIPVDYQSTLMNSIDNFGFQNVGYGQFTGVLAYRPLELMYFTYTPAP